jgi:hypothetical protein
VIRAPFDQPAVLAKLRPLYLERGSLLLPGACDPAAAPDAALTPFFVPNRGRYQVADLAPREDLRLFAEALTGARLKAFSLRLYRFGHGDYALFYDDSFSRVPEGVELTLDLSPDLGGPAAVYQSTPTEKLEIPQIPGLVAAVSRGPGTFRYDRYLPAAVGTLRVLRLRATFLRGD